MKCSLFLLFLFVSFSYATTRSVGTGSGFTFQSILAAVAGSSNGDTLYVDPSVPSLNQTVTINKSLSFIGNGTAPVSLTSTAFTYFFIVASTGVSFNNFRFYGGYDSCFYLNSGSSLSGTKLTFDSFLYGGSEDPVVYLNTNTNVTVTYSTFKNNSVPSIVSYCETTPKCYLLVQNCVFYRNGANTVDNFPGGITLFGNTNFSLSNTLFIANQGDLYFENSGNQLALSNNSFYRDRNNTYSGTDYAIKCASSNVMSQQNNFFCGSNGNKVVSCSSYMPDVVLVPFDGCEVCYGENAIRDCTGTCFGPGTGCPTHTTWYVSPTGSDSNSGTSSSPFKTIQKGLNSASNGDTVNVNDGVYSGYGNIGLTFKGKRITLTSSTGCSESDFVIIDCKGNNTAFFVNSGEDVSTTIIGLSIKNCSDSAIQVSKGAISIYNTKIGISSEVYTGGGGITVSPGGYVVLDTCHLYNNSQTGGVLGGGAIYAVGNGTTAAGLKIRYSQFTSNTAGGDGSAISVDTVIPLISNSIFANNYQTGINYVVTDIKTLHGGLSLSNSSFYRSNTTTYLGRSTAAFYASGVEQNQIYPGSVSNLICGNYTYAEETTGGSVHANPFTNYLTWDSCNLCNGGNAELDCSGVCWGNNFWTLIGFDFFCCNMCTGTCM